jgi:4-amino-4-deoxy-L-arabinose transferase-like glycosyltransferase
MMSGLLQPFQPAGRNERAVTALIALIVFIIAFINYNSEVTTTAFHPDESRWINRAHYLEDVLDPFGPTWNDQYLTRGQPPMGSYVMGIGLLAQGRDLDTNRAWDYRRGGDWNVQNGMYPTQDDLHTGRRTDVFLGAVAVAVTFLAVRLLSNTIGGLVAAGILTFHPLQAWHDRLALADTTLTLTLATLVLTLILLTRRPGWFKALAVGILIGLGGANKLTPMALAFVVAGAGGILLLWTIWRNWRARLRGEPWYAAIPGVQHLSWMLISAPIVAGATFVAVYPYLWKQPIANTLKILDFRENEMEVQARLYPQFAVETTGEAIRKTWASLADRWSATEWVLDRIGLHALGSALSPLDLILAMIGVVLLVILAAQMPFRSGHLLVTLVLIVQVMTIVLAMRTDFERYYLPIVLANAMFAGAGVGIASQSILHLVETRRARPAPSAAGVGQIPRRGSEATGQ